MTPLELAAIARRTSEAAGALIRSMGSPKDVSHKGTVDLVTEVDVASEREVRRLLAEATPDIPSSPRRAAAPARAPAGSSTRSTARRTSCMATRPTRSASAARSRVPSSPQPIHDVVNDRTYWAARGRGRLVRRATPSGVGRADARARPSSSRASPPTAGARGVLRRMVEAFLSRGQCIRGVAPRRSTSACSRTAGSMGTGSSASRLGRRGRHPHRRGRPAAA
jgi:hypothetical protein